jgi:hypothetical protein
MILNLIALKIWNASVNCASRAFGARLAIGVENLGELDVLGLGNRGSLGVGGGPRARGLAGQIPDAAARRFQLSLQFRDALVRIGLRFGELVPERRVLAFERNVAVAGLDGDVVELAGPRASDLGLRRFGGPRSGRIFFDQWGPICPGRPFADTMLRRDQRSAPQW